MFVTMPGEFVRVLAGRFVIPDELDGTTFVADEGGVEFDNVLADGEVFVAGATRPPRMMIGPAAKLAVVPAMIAVKTKSFIISSVSELTFS
jgi:hypothetical protein